MHAASRIATVAAAVVLASSSASPQGAVPPAAVRGIAVDSLRAQPLAGAFVMVEGTGRGSTTDSLGRFMVDSIAPGDYRLVLLHPFLDTLGVGVVTPVMRLAAGEITTVTLATPSVRTLVRAKCGTRQPPNDAAIVGLVVDSESDEPIPDATLTLSWIAVIASTELGLRRVPHQRVAATAPDGTFRFCGLPADVVGEISATRGTDTTSAVPVWFENSALAVRTLGIARAAGGAVLRGRVTNVGGAPIPGARVSMSAGRAATLTDADGRFVLDADRAGSRTVNVRRVGFKPAEFAVNLSSSRPTEIMVALSEFVTVLDTVRVRARVDAALSRVGFTQRHRSGIGRYLTIEDIERRRPNRLVELLAGIPSLRTQMTPTGDLTIVGRMRVGEFGCVRYFVDSQRWPDDDTPLDFVHPSELAGVEVYSAEVAPGEFQTPGSDCTVVVMWTRHKLGIGGRR